MERMRLREELTPSTRSRTTLMDDRIDHLNTNTMTTRTRC